jgi:hypothetical protein
MIPQGDSPTPVLLKSLAKPGVKRDGTQLEGDYYTDAQWCRWQRGLPRKMGGMRAISELLAGPVRGVYASSRNDTTRIYCGSSNNLEYLDVATNSGIGAGVGDRTPATLVPSLDNIWQIGQFFDQFSAELQVLAFAAPNMELESTEKRKLWIGPMTDSTPLVDSTAPEVSGGFLVAGPYVVAYGDDGYVANCVPFLPMDWTGTGSDELNICPFKIVYGMPIRGGAGSSPAFLLWSTGNLNRATFNGSSTVFDYDDIAEITIISSRCVVEFNGMAYWIGVDRFFMYNGVVQDLPNEFNRNWFFDNVNRNQLGKIWGTKISAFGEIIWHFPFGDSEECNATIIFNVFQGIWYDNSIARTAGYFARVFQWPIWASPEVSDLFLVRALGGTATSSAGTAANAFDGDVSTECDAGPDGSITYDWGQYSAKRVVQIAIDPGISATMDLLFEYTTDDGVVPATWVTLLDLPGTVLVDGVTQTFDLNVDVAMRAIRLSSSGGGDLEMREIYYNVYGHVLYQQEFGYDHVIGGRVYAINSWFTTNELWAAANGEDRWITLSLTEPDFVQSGVMTMEVLAKNYARSEPEVRVVEFDEDTNFIDTSFEGRQMKFRFRSNTQGGNFELGDTLLHLAKGDAQN